MALSKNYMCSVIASSADKAHKNGASFEGKPWVKVSKDGVSDIDWDGYVHSEKRNEISPCVWRIDLSSGENNLFGTETVNNKHFTEYSLQHSTEKGEMADKQNRETHERHELSRSE